MTAGHRIGPAAEAAGIVVESVGGGQARVRLRVTEAMLNGHGIAHGGTLFLVADTAFDLACNSHGPLTVARSCEIVFIDAVRAGDELVAEAVETARRGRNGVYDVTVGRAGGDPVALFRGQSRTIADGALDPPEDRVAGEDVAHLEGNPRRDEQPGPDRGPG